MKEYCKNLNVGDNIRVEEDGTYIVRAKSENFLICTRPHLDNVMYFIIDLERMVRGTNNRVFNPYDYSKDKDILICLDDLENNKCEVTRRYDLPLDVITDDSLKVFSIDFLVEEVRSFEVEARDEEEARRKAFDVYHMMTEDSEVTNREITYISEK